MNQQSQIIEDFPNYKIYTNGEVENIKTKRILKHKVDTPGYAYVTLFKKGMYKNMSIHRLLGKYFIPRPHNDCTLVDHIDRNKLTI